MAISILYIRNGNPSAKAVNQLGIGTRHHWTLCQHPPLVGLISAKSISDPWLHTRFSSPHSAKVMILCKLYMVDMQPKFHPLQSNGSVGQPDEYYSCLLRPGPPSILGDISHKCDVLWKSRKPRCPGSIILLAKCPV